MNEFTIDFEKSQFSRLLYSIVTKGSAAVKKIIEEQKYSKYSGLHTSGGFWYYKPPETSKGCECWFELQYFDFIAENAINDELIRALCLSLVRDKCRHIIELEEAGENEEQSYAYCSTTLIHAACAAGNIHVLEHLLNKPRLLFETMSIPGLKPLHLAVIKSQSEVLDFLYRRIDTGVTSAVDIISSEETVVYRDLVSGKLEETTCPDCGCLFAKLLLIFQVTEKSTIVNLFKILYQVMPLAYLQYILISLVLNGATESVLDVLTVKHFAEKNLLRRYSSAKNLLLACVMTDADDILQVFKARDLNIHIKVEGYNMLDVALAFASERCISILACNMDPTPNVYKKLSPYNFLLLTSGLLPLVDDRVMIRKCQEQGFDINGVDARFSKPPIHLAFAKQQLKFVKPLLEAGADVNGEYCGKTLVMLSIETYVCTQRGHNFVLPCINIGVLKELLYYNPSPELTTNALYVAVQYDMERPYLQNAVSKKVIKFKSNRADEGETDIFANSFKDRIMTVSTFALLQEFGFTSKDAYEDYVRQKIEDDDVPSPSYLQFHEYITLVRSNPRSLKSCCRIAIRKALPGHKLHEYFSTLNYPHILTNYVVRPYILRETVIQD